MHSFFILGQIPGTSIEITFEMWALLVSAVVATYMLIVIHRRQASLRLTRTSQSTISQD